MGITAIAIDGDAYGTAHSEGALRWGWELGATVILSIFFHLLRCLGAESFASCI